MTDINNLFFELIQVSLGTRTCLSHTPSADEWGELYAMAKKQSLVGVCFAGVQRLQLQQQCPPEMLYLTWMGMAAKIQQRNEVVNRQCVDLQKRLAADGMDSCILKGQGVASLYSEHLRVLRQSGDIDVWILSEDGENDGQHFVRIMQYAKGIAPIDDFNQQHVSVPFFEDTEVEVHFTPSLMCNPIRNRRLQEWFRKYQVSDTTGSPTEGFRFQEVDKFRSPSAEFNVVYLLQHCYNHLLFEGVGLRQIMDYYMVLRTVSHLTGYFDSAQHKSGQALGFKVSEFQEVLTSLGLMKFAGAMMWGIGYVFEDYNSMKPAEGDETLKLFETMGISPNEKEGRFLLNEIMTGGNFGKYGKDGVMEGHAKGKVAFFFASMKHKMRFLTHYPSEVIWAPYSMVTHYLWKLRMKKKLGL